MCLFFKTIVVNANSDQLKDVKYVLLKYKADISAFFKYSNPVFTKAGRPTDKQKLSACKQLKQNKYKKNNNY